MWITQNPPLKDSPLSLRDGTEEEEEEKAGFHCFSSSPALVLLVPPTTTTREFNEGRRTMNSFKVAPHLNISSPISIVSHFSSPHPISPNWISPDWIWPHRIWPHWVWPHHWWTLVVVTSHNMLLFWSGKFSLPRTSEMILAWDHDFLSSSVTWACLIHNFSLVWCNIIILW